MSDRVVSVEGLAAVLAASIDETAVSFTVEGTADGFPASSFQVQIDNEVILVGSRTGSTFSGLSRAQEGTVAHAHPKGAAVGHVVGGELLALGGGLPAGGSTGQVLTKASGADGDAGWEAPQGGAAGVAIVRGPFPFAFDTPNINNGVAIYTPTVGDILLDAWIELDTTFDGTTPLADIGQFSDVTFGLWGGNTVAIPLDTVPDDETGAGTGLLTFGHRLRPTLQLSNVNGDMSLDTPFRQVPAKFMSAAPLLLVVSQDGTKGGAAVGGTAGAGNVYLITATPTAS